MNEKILITGGSGFIGTNLVGYLLEKGYEIINIDIKPPQNMNHLKQWKQINILDYDGLEREIKKFKPSALIHLAAKTDLDEMSNLDGYAANFEGTTNLLRIIRNTNSIQRTILTSSQLVCRIGYKPKDMVDFCPSTLYGRSKMLMEKIIHSADDFCQTWAIIRPTSFWGPWFGIP